VSGIGTDGWLDKGYRVRYNIAQNRYERLPALAGQASGQAENGWIVGSVTDATDKMSHPVIYAGSKVVRLPEYKPTPTTQYLVGAISRDGHVAVGSSLVLGGKHPEETPLVWACR
jgi:hypothetical protein